MFAPRLFVMSLMVLTAAICPEILPGQASPFLSLDSGITPFTQPPAPPTITLPPGTRLPLVLENAISTRTAKPGDTVYFQTTYPIARDNRIVIPMGTFARAEIISIKRPGRLKGRAELQMRITSLTFSNGYVVSFAALPSNLDAQAPENLDGGGKINGASGVAKDVSTVASATMTGLAVGTYGGIVGAASTSSARAFSTGVLAGGGAGLLTGVLVVALSRGPDVQFRPGTALQALFDRPLTLDPALLPPNTPGTPFVPPPSAYADAGSARRHRCHSPIIGLACP
jgi:hypothetical protein